MPSIIKDNECGVGKNILMLKPTLYETVIQRRGMTLEKKRNWQRIN